MRSASTSSLWSASTLTSTSRSSSSGGGPSANAKKAPAKEVPALPPFGSSNKAYLPPPVAPEIVAAQHSAPRYTYSPPAGSRVNSHARSRAGSQWGVRQLRDEARHLREARARHQPPACVPALSLPLLIRGALLLGKGNNIDPSNVAALEDRAMLAKEIGNLRTTRLAFLGILEHFSHDLNILSELCTVLIDLGDLDTCASLFQSASPRARPGSARTIPSIASSPRVHTIGSIAGEESTVIVRPCVVHRGYAGFEGAVDATPFGHRALRPAPVLSTCRGRAHAQCHARVPLASRALWTRADYVRIGGGVFLAKDIATLLPPHSRQPLQTTTPAVTLRIVAGSSAFTPFPAPTSLPQDGSGLKPERGAPHHIGAGAACSGS
ncbi:hypothetical protein B0H16DRAFT_1814831 [Mycena metata]|uniref:Uncharacterized protein n=1 Tax=Mycena metata TaxID=1033252 RepID=A0AAD7H507_9AGAR|nr:hypothetical protein B0H16DRAFT_1814831 [Mycena metata]